MENLSTNSEAVVQQEESLVATALCLSEFMKEKCLKSSYEVRMNDIQKKILFKAGVTLEFLNQLNKFVKVKLVVSTYKNSTYFRNGFNQIVFIDIYNSI